MAYTANKQAAAKSAGNYNVNSLALEVAVIIQESSIGWRQLTVGKDASGKANSSSSDSDSEFDRRNYSNKKKSTYFRRNQNYQNQRDQASSKPTDNATSTQYEAQSSNSKNNSQNQAPKDGQRSGQQSLPRTPCPNCKKPGHWRRDCPEKQNKLKCWTCDEPGVTKKFAQNAI